MKYEAREGLGAVNEADIAYLTALCPGRVAWENISEDYAHDEMPEYGHALPAVLVEAESTEEVSALMRYAWERSLPVTPRGSGTGLCGGCVPVCGGILLSLARMNRVLEIDRNTLTARVQPGVLLMDFIKETNAQGLLYPPDPGEKSATLGGNVMTNAGGMRAVKYGVTREYVLALTAVMPDGEVIHTGGKVAKSSSGYSLKDLLIGSEGTLAVVTELTLKLIPLPKYNYSLLAPFKSLAACVGAVPRLLMGGILPTAIEFMEREVIRDAEKYLNRVFPDRSSDAYLLLLFDGNDRDYLERLCDSASALLIENGALDVLISNTEERHEAIWSARGAFLEAIKSGTPSMDECDVVVPRDKVEEFIRYAHALSAQYEVEIKSFGHAGDGNLHIYVLKNSLLDEVWHCVRKHVMDALYSRARELCGQVSGEHGIGHAKAAYLEESLEARQIELMRGIKSLFDPKGILNPGKVVR